MATTPVLGIPELAAQQQQPEVTHNIGILLLQALQYGAKAIQNAPPGSPAAGDVYVVGTSPTGAWSGRANTIAIYYGGWKFVPDRDNNGTPIVMGASQAGLRIPVAGVVHQWSGSEWVAQSTVTGIGINAIRRLTQAQYDALVSPDPDTLYVIVG